MLLAFAGVDRHELVLEPGLLEEERDFCGVRRGMVVELDHVVGR